jgi:hypothetical protein
VGVVFASEPLNALGEKHWRYGTPLFIELFSKKKKCNPLQFDEIY